ncbi:nucleotidyl transferase AbiEii/AbiGii toxin family protein [bacterium]|nr:nucleotidyl transferase AbiEii/AbiGii toxin family protein [candidate division CSSED10-310 bacterium]
MENIATWNMNERRDLFAETSARRDISPAIVEKDFWVCWTLKRLFASETLSKKLIFKGGTSLSKIFGIIERFSEDIDLILDWREVSEEDPRESRSKTKQDRFNKQIVRDSREYIKETMVAEVNDIVRDICEVDYNENEPDVIKVRYPKTFEDEYLRSEVLLEIGPLAQWIPNDRYEMSSYAAQEFPKIFKSPSFFVRAISAERSFWEKATILHLEAFRPEGKKQPLRYSRHYYDMVCMAKSHVKESALRDVELLRSVVAFKQKFYPQGWARYDLAVPGSFKLIPEEDVLKSLEKDYSEMRMMIFGEIPSFDQLISSLKELENDINNLVRTAPSRP